MLANTTADRDSTETETEPRTFRALTEYLTVLPAGADGYGVVSESGRSYAVDVDAGTGDCPDPVYRDVRCKHLQRVVSVTGASPSPARSTARPSTNTSAGTSMGWLASRGGCILSAVQRRNRRFLYPA